MRCLITTQKGNIFPDDVFIFNDPYVAAGQHLPDIYIIKPIFYRGRARRPGRPRSPTTPTSAASCRARNALGAVEIYQEGLRIPILKFMERGKPIDPVWQLVALNVRAARPGDGRPAGADGGVHRLRAQHDRPVPALRPRDDDAHISATCTTMRSASRAPRSRDIPDGAYRFTDHIDGLGKKPVPIVLQAKVIGRGRRRDDRLDRLVRAGEGRHQLAAAVHQGLRLHGDALDHDGRRAELLRLHARHQGGGAAKARVVNPPLPVPAARAASPAIA